MDHCPLSIGSRCRTVYRSTHPVAIGVVLAIVSAGCQPKSSPTPARTEVVRLSSLSALGAAPGKAIVSQGQLLPESGLIAVAAGPGDRLAELSVREGQVVKAGESIGRLASQSAREGELAVAEAQLAEAEQQFAAGQAVAQAELSVAEIGFRQAQLKVSQAEEEYAREQAAGGQLQTLTQQIAFGEEKLSQLRRAANDPDAGNLVTANSIQQQELTVNQARANLLSAKAEAEDLIKAGRLAVEAAQQQLETAKLKIESAEVSSAFESLAEQIKLLKLQVEASRLLSPIDGTVVTVQMQAGEPTRGTPIVQIANLDKMICRVEVNVAQLSEIEVGSQAAITSPALATALRGKVQSVSRVIGSPRLPDPNPLAQTDFRTAEVVVVIDPEDVPHAADRIQLQVDVAIESSGQ
ncbi:hypothetical protein FF011L_16400 [Roseimaritima multifibrata]|uniref:Uncharacterized protein n=1 Tax=Roseimaritima multifibrata TaxID=1930274 RepID=A0A517MDI0_9BACT|nr:HlyD family efflux transporter periplasmic adaptor subunit [Roseimaritima multifibrata]QDS92886.1 hypothetical protein FF011L_16400 [Roseimaritima multifibrata]